MRTRLATFLAVLALAAPAWAQNAMDHTVLRDYDVDNTTLLYACLADPDTRAGMVKTAQGGGTTLTVMGGGTFSGLAAGDLITVNGNYLTVVTHPTPTTVTVSGSSVDLYNGGSGYPWTLSKFTSGTGDDVCWVDISAWPEKQLVSVEYNQGDLTGGLSFRVEGKTSSPGALPHRIYPSSALDCVGVAMTYSAGYCNLPTASVGIDDRVDFGNIWPYTKLRVGFLIVTADPSEAGANLEKVSIFIRAENAK